MIHLHRKELVLVAVAVVMAMSGSGRLSMAQTSSPPASTTPVSAASKFLDYEFFKTRIEPIFLKKRSAAHARCYSCHEESKHDSGLRLETLSPGSEFWTEEQSRHNFQVVSQLVIPGSLTASMFLIHPLAPEAGGDSARVHSGGRQFESQDDPDWQTMASWVRGAKASSGTAPQ